MNASDLAMKMLEWEAKRRELDQIEEEITGAVMELGKTQVVGNVRATYNKGRTTLDYQAAAEGHPMVNEHTITLFTVPKTDWRKICAHAGIDDVPILKQYPPGVKIKLEDK